ncbi:MAG: carboxymuconolactone decarboxylase family protein [Thermoleophilia bacterium]
MEDVHKIFTQFKQEFPDVYTDYERLGRGIHQRGGPLDDKTRALLKLAVSGAAGHLRALETHVLAAREAEVSEEEIKHALLMLITTCGFPTFMEAYRTYAKLGD